MARSELHVANNTREDVDFVWVRPDGTEKFYETISPAHFFVVYTFDTHVWNFKSNSSKAVLKQYTAGPYLHTMNVVDLPDVPDVLTCEITLSFMHDPVRASDGHIYDLFTVYKLFQHNPISRFSREPLTRTLVVQRELADACARFSEEHDCVHPSRRHQTPYDTFFDFV
jgi:hypothetical protein